jgi:hypothetical protein
METMMMMMMMMMTTKRNGGTDLTRINTGCQADQACSSQPPGALAQQRGQVAGRE